MMHPGGRRPDLPQADGRHATDPARSREWPGPGAHEVLSMVGKTSAAWSIGPSRHLHTNARGEPVPSPASIAPKGFDLASTFVEEDPV